MTAAARPDRALYDAWAPFYDLTDVDHASAIGFYKGVIRPGMRSMLDLGCGTGANTTAIAQALEAPRRVVGVDASAGMLERAVTRDPSVHWIRADFRDAPTAGDFDLVTCCFNTLQMIPPADLVHLFTHVAGRLSPRGVFAFDVYQPNSAYLADPPRDRVAREVRAPDGRRLQTREDGSYDPEARILHLAWRLVDAQHPGATPLASLALQVHQHDTTLLRQALGSAGLQVEAAYGDFDGSALTPFSRKQVFTCIRQQDA